MGESEHRLTDIIRVNARRVSQIVESVLALSRRSSTRPERLQLVPWVEDFTREFVQTLELYEGAVSLVGDSPDIEVRMDPTHLHQVLWNLCDNAVKYASVAAGAIAVEISCGVLEPSAGEATVLGTTWRASPSRSNAASDTCRRSSACTPI